MSADRTLISEIERDLLDGKPLADLLRKCVVLAGQAGSPELRKWATQELRGYDTAEDVPKYRSAHLGIYIDAITGNSWVKNQQVNPASLPEFCRDLISEEVPMMQGVGELEAIAATGESARIPLPGWDTIGQVIDRASGNPFQQTHALYWSVTVAALAGVLDNVRATLAELVAELRVAVPRNQETPTPEQVSQAVSVAVHGAKSRVALEDEASREGLRRVPLRLHPPGSVAGQRGVQRPLRQQCSEPDCRPSPRNVVPVRSHPRQRRLRRGSKVTMPEDTVELVVAPGAGTFELAADEDEALADDWAGVPGPVRIATDRVGIDCASRVSSPTVVLRSYLAEPPPLAASAGTPLSETGVWQVTFTTGQVEVWTTFSGPADGPALTLPAAPKRQYRMRVAASHVDTGGRDLADYEAELAVADQEIPDGLERFEIDFWPAG